VHENTEADDTYDQNEIFDDDYISAAESVEDQDDQKREKCKSKGIVESWVVSNKLKTIQNLKI
jgi:hypothetical protein